MTLAMTQEKKSDNKTILEQKNQILQLLTTVGQEQSKKINHPTVSVITLASGLDTLLEKQYKQLPALKAQQTFNKTNLFAGSGDNKVAQEDQKTSGFSLQRR